MSVPKSLNAATNLLTDAVKTCLEETGTLGRIHCQIRSDIVSALKSNPDDNEDKKEPHLSADNFLINELLREYLDWNGYVHAKDVLSAESGQPKLGLDRRELEKALGLECGPNAAKVPLLYSIVANLKRKRD